MSHVDLDEMRALLRAQVAPKGASASAASPPPRRAAAAEAPETRDLFEALDTELANPPLFAATPPPPPSRRPAFGKRSPGPAAPAAPLLLTHRTDETPLRLDALASARAADAVFAETPFHPGDLADEDLFAAREPPPPPPAGPMAVTPEPAPVLDTRRRRLLHGLAQTLAQEQDQLDAARSDVAAPLILSPLRRRRGERDYQDLGFANDRH